MHSVFGKWWEIDDTTLSDSQKYMSVNEGNKYQSCLILSWTHGSTSKRWYSVAAYLSPYYREWKLFILISLRENDEIWIAVCSDVGSVYSLYKVAVQDCYTQTIALIAPQMVPPTNNHRRY